MVLDLLRGPLSGNAGVAEAGLGALANLANNFDNRILLVALGACEGESLSAFSTDFFIDHFTGLCIYIL